MAGEGEIRGITETANSSMKALMELLRLIRSERSRFSSRHSSRELDLKSGAVEYSKLKEAVDRKGESLGMQDGIPEKHLPQIRESAKKYGISVAAVGGKDDNNNYTIAFRGRDKALFQQIMSDVVKSEMAVHPDDYVRLPLKEWEVIPMQTELDTNNINAHIIRNDNGDYFCVCQNSEKTQLTEINDRFTKAHGEVVEKFAVKQSDDSYILQDKSSGKQIILDKSGSYSADNITARLADDFGYDRTKSSIAAWSFASTLEGERLEDFFEVNALSEIHLDNDSPLIVDYSFYRVNIKDDGVDRFVVMDGDGKTTMLENSGNSDILKNMGIDDERTINALIEKYNTLNVIYSERAKELREIEVDNSTLEINRLDKDNFEVKCGDETRSFSFSDKNQSVDEMSTFVNGATSAGFVQSRVIANQAFENAQQQSFQRSVPEIEKAPLPEYEINREVGGTFTVRFGEIVNEYNLDDKKAVVDSLKDDFGMSTEKAVNIFDKAQEQNAVELEAEQLLAGQAEDLQSPTPDMQFNVNTIPPPDYMPDIPPPDVPLPDIPPPDFDFETPDLD